MSQKKKTSKNKKSERRLEEVKRAHSKEQNRGVSSSFAAQPSPKALMEEKPKDLKYSLPVKDIKKDMFKNISYVVFTLAVLLLLKHFDIGFDDIRSLIYS